MITVRETKVKAVSVCSKMAEPRFPVNQDHLRCAICLDLLKDPVTILCGHSYCMGCIKDYWDKEDYIGVYSCPQCRRKFTSRPDLGKNTMLAEVVERLKTNLDDAPPAHHYAGPGDVECDACTGRKLRAVKSCLVCLASYCHTDLQLHERLNTGKGHRLIDATGQLRNKICSRHDKPLEIYCRTDQQCVCYLCTIDEHRGHDTVLAAAERTEKQQQMAETQREFEQRIQEGERELQELRQAVDSLKLSAEAAVEKSERIFSEMIRCIERRCTEVTRLIRDQEKAALSQAERLLEKLEQEIADLRRRDTELEQLSHTEDHVHFLQNCPSLSVPPGHEQLSSPHCSFEDLTKAVSELKDKLEGICKEKIVRISEIGKTEMLLQIPEPRTREDFLHYASHFTLDPNTAFGFLSVSEGDRKVIRNSEILLHPDHPERFETTSQVFCRESVTGRCYWEVQWSDVTEIGVMYKGIGDYSWNADCAVGDSDKSWSLYCYNNYYSIHHNKKRTSLPVRPSGSDRIGVYVDWAAGTLSFYRVSSDDLTHLYTFTCNFTEPLYPVFEVLGSVSLCDLV